MNKRRYWDVGKLERYNEQRDAEQETVKAFKNIKRYYPELEYKDVLIVTSTAVKMKDGKVYRILGQRNGIK